MPVTTFKSTSVAAFAINTHIQRFYCCQSCNHSSPTHLFLVPLLTPPRRLFDCPSTDTATRALPQTNV
ncbi:hypothetical protein ACET3X_006393 [Alternaria dauci]|uniref:Uncharacterized protein n=1 Tax=Alternaria dauci TaxID=48095 RepID=A0ABR3UEG6_9PLEO